MDVFKPSTEHAKPRDALVGHARHGKGTTSQFLNQAFGMSCVSTSYMAGKEFIFDKMKAEHGYATFEECYEDRYNHSDFWFNEILDYNTTNLAALGELVFTKHDGIDGVRDDGEFLAIKGAHLFDFSIWVDASKRKPLEPATSMKVKRIWRAGYSMTTQKSTSYLAKLKH